MTDVAPILRAGDRGLLVECGGIPPHLVAAALRNADTGDLIEDLVPAAVTVLIVARTAAAMGEISAGIATALRGAEVARASMDDTTVLDPLVIEVDYSGMDLAEVASRTDLSVDDVIRAHSDAVHRVDFFGFAPGFAYIGGNPETLALPRLPEPRARVAAGSVAIAGGQTVIYPGETPGGWHVIGHTRTTLWNIDATPPALAAVGQAIRFTPVQSS